MNGATNRYFSVSDEVIRLKPSRRLSALSSIILLLASFFVPNTPAAADGIWSEDLCTQNLGCWPRSPVPPPDVCGVSDLGLTPVVSVNGTLVGPLGGIEGGCVYWYNSVHYGSAITGVAGVYTIQVPADATAYTPVVLYAYHPYYTWDSIVITNSALAATEPQDFHVAFLHETSVNPGATNNNPPQALTFTMLMTSPPDLSRSLAELPWGVLLELEHDPTYSARVGWSKFVASATPPAGYADGVHRFSSCVLKIPSGGSCSSPGSDVILSDVEPNLADVGVEYRPYLIIDSINPYFGTPSPLPTHNTTHRQPGISVDAFDALSGVNASSSRLELDGTQVATGRTWYVPSSPLSLGVHTATATAVDYAGNTASISWSFDVVALTPSSASASVTPKTVLVNPNNAIPGPSKVYISGVATQLPPYNLELSSSSLWSGTGTIKRSVNYSGLKATFENELGQSMIVDAPTVNVTFAHSIAVLEPNSSRLGVEVSSASSTLPGIWVEIPDTFLATDEATVTLSGGSHPANHDVVPAIGGDPIPTTLDCSLSSECIVKGVVSCNFSKVAEEKSYSCNGTYPRTTLERKSSSLDVDVLGNVAGQIESEASQNSSTYGKYPEPNPVDADNCGTETACTNAFNVNDKVARLTAIWSTGDLFRAYSYHYYFRIASSAFDRMAVWQASDVTPGSSGCKKALLQEFGHSVESKGDWSVAGPNWFAPTAGDYDSVFKDADENVLTTQDVQLRRDEGGALVYHVGGVGGGKNVDLSPVQEDGTYLRGDYSHDLGKMVSPNGSLVTGTAASYNFWAPSAPPYPDYRDRHAEVMTGTEHERVSSDDFSFRSVLYFQFDLVHVC